MGGIYPNQWNGCEGLCFLEVDAIGFAFDCEEVAPETVDYGKKLADAFQNGEEETADLFEISFDTKYYGGPVSPSVPVSESVTSSSYLDMNITYTNASDGRVNLNCPGTKYRQHCKLWPSIVRYPVQVENSTSAFTVSVGGKMPSGDGSLDGMNEGMNNENLAKFNKGQKQQDG